MNDEITFKKEYLKSDDIGPPIKNFYDVVIEAQKQAFKEGIEANTIVINENIGKVNPFTFTSFQGIHMVPPMICGMNVYFTKDELPDNCAFAMFETNQTNRLAEFESIGMEPEELRKAAVIYKTIKETLNG